MVLRTMHAAVLSAIVGVASAAVARAGSAELLPVQVFESARAPDAPVANSAFVPGEGALAAPGAHADFAGSAATADSRPRHADLPGSAAGILHGRRRAGARSAR